MFYPFIIGMCWGTTEINIRKVGIILELQTREIDTLTNNCYVNNYDTDKLFVENNL